MKRRRIAALILAFTLAALPLARNSQPLPQLQGELIDVGGHRLHLIRSGIGKKGPTVVLECGLFGCSANWGWIMRELSRYAPVVAYDRAGLGWSDPVPGESDGLSAVTHLHELLSRAKIPPPYLMVGHSYGGALVRLYHARYPQEVSGVVLIDSVNPDYESQDPVLGTRLRRLLLLVRTAPVLAKTGLLDLISFGKEEVAGLPEREERESLHHLRSVKHLTGTAAEAAAWETTLREVRSAGNFGAIPEAVIASEIDRPPSWQALQKQLATLSLNASYRLIPGATHTSLVTRREHAAQVVAEIRRIIRLVRRR